METDYLMLPFLVTLIYFAWWGRLTFEPYSFAFDRTVKQVLIAVGGAYASFLGMIAVLYAGM